MREIKTPTFKSLTKGYYYVNSEITEKNFPIPKDLKLPEHCKIIKMDKPFLSAEALERIKKEGCRPGTIWELALLKQERPELWPSGQWSSIVAFGTDFTDAGGDHRVPLVHAYAGGDFEFRLGYFGYGWNAVHCLVCFCDSQHSDALAFKSDLGSFDPSALTEEMAIELLKERGFIITKQF